MDDDRDLAARLERLAPPRSEVDTDCAWRHVQSQVRRRRRINRGVAAVAVAAIVGAGALALTGTSADRGEVVVADGRTSTTGAAAPTAWTFPSPGGEIDRRDCGFVEDRELEALFSAPLNRQAQGGAVLPQQLVCVWFSTADPAEVLTVEIHPLGALMLTDPEDAAREWLTGNGAVDADRVPVAGVDAVVYAVHDPGVSSAGRPAVLAWASAGGFLMRLDYAAGAPGDAAVARTVALLEKITPRLLAAAPAPAATSTTTAPSPASTTTNRR